MDRMKRLLFLIALFTCVAMAHVQRHDAVYVDGKRCSLTSYPLNAYISTHYSEWPFRPTFHGPGDGGGYWGFWGIRDSLLYLDSLTINTWGRSSIVIGHGDRKHFSVRIPLQEIIREGSSKKSLSPFKKDEPLYAFFVNDTLEVSCSNKSYTINESYTFYVEKGRAHLLQHASDDMPESGFDLLRNSKNKKPKRTWRKSRQEKQILPYSEKKSLLATYYYMLDNLRKKQDDSDKQKYIVEPRKDPNFKRFEDFFEINAVDPDYLENNMSYTFFVSSKRETPFPEIVFDFVMDIQTHKFKDSPADAVELFEKSYASIRKNRLFEKWLQEKKSRMNYSDIYFKREENVSAGFQRFSIEEVWKNTKMSGNYVGTLTFNGVVLVQHNFLLSDNGDVLILGANPPKGEKLLNIADGTDEKRILMKFCHEPVVGENQPADPLFCDYVIIRHDGKIEYGPKSEKP